MAACRLGLFKAKGNDALTSEKIAQTLSLDKKNGCY